MPEIAFDGIVACQVQGAFDIFEAVWHPGGRVFKLAIFHQKLSARLVTFAPGNKAWWTYSLFETCF